VPTATVRSPMPPAGAGAPAVSPASCHAAGSAVSAAQTFARMVAGDAPSTWTRSTYRPGTAGSPVPASGSSGLPRSVWARSSSPPPPVACRPTRT
jgi:hypothetical protein